MGTAALTISPPTIIRDIQSVSAREKRHMHPPLVLADTRHQSSLRADSLMA